MRQFSHSIMYPIVNEAVMKISTCEIDVVKDANNWKFIKNDKNPTMSEQSVYMHIIKFYQLQDLLFVSYFR
jgi:hypothetical protein